MSKFVKIEDVYINPDHVMAVEEAEIVGVTRILVGEGGRRVEYRTSLSVETIARKFNRRTRRGKP